MRPIRRSLVGAAAALAAGPALAIEWGHRIAEVSDDSTLDIGTAGICYDDGPSVLRVQGQTMDLSLADDDLALPPDRTLGTLDFPFGTSTLTLQADSCGSDDGRPVDHLHLIPSRNRSEEIPQRLRRFNAMEIAFPDGMSHTVDLTGSGVALIEAFECWRREDRGRRRRRRAPFGSGGPDAPQGSNPFK